MAIRPSQWSPEDPLQSVVDLDRDARPELSVVIPVHDEQDNVGPLYQALNDALQKLGRTYEIIVVDDGSRDETYTRLTRIAAGDARLKLVKLRRNYGQTAAMAAGFDHARGRIIVPMDGDMQNDPADIGPCWRRSTRATTSSPAGDATDRTASRDDCPPVSRTG